MLARYPLGWDESCSSLLNHGATNVQVPRRIIAVPLIHSDLLAASRPRLDSIRLTTKLSKHQPRLTKAT